MEEYILENNLKLIYKHSNSELTSICISIDAGAGVEYGNKKIGIAHIVEHMIYKGTKNRSELEINESLSNIFGFQNAMTNYSYVIYYGTLLGADFRNGTEIFSDIIMNPIFTDDKFKEEMNVIKEELNEWDEELEQYCEDQMFINSFEERRIKYPIIGTAESLDSITLSDIKKFYEEHYFPENTSIVVISSLEFTEVKNIVEEYLGIWKNENSNELNKDIQLHSKDIEIQYEIPKINVFSNKKDSIKTCKVEIICSIDQLNENEMKALRIFNQYFGEGVNSILYDTLRTKNGLIYDVITTIAHENYIKLYKITFSTCKENVRKTLDLVDECIEKIDLLKNIINDNMFNQLVKNLKLKRLFREEQKIILAKELATYDTMFGDYNLYINEVNNLEQLDKNDICETGKQVLKNLTIQIIY